MSEIIKNVIIIGANGNLGPSVLQALDEADFTVSVLSRKGSKSTYASHIQVHEVDESYPEEELVTAFRGQDAVVLTIPVSDTQKNKALVDASIKAGVKRFIPSEFGSDTSSDEAVEKVPFMYPKREISKYLQSKEDSGLTWTAIITGAFFDWGIKQGFLGFDIKAKTAAIYDDGDAPLLGTLLSNIGKTVVGVLQRPEAGNRFVYVADYRTTQNEILAGLEKAAGGEKYQITKINSAEEYKESLPKVLQGDYSVAMNLLRSVIYSGDTIYDYDKNHGLENDKLDLPKPEPLEELLAEIVKE